MIIIRPKVSKAFTLIELMIAMAIIIIAAVGALGYQYYAAKQSRIGYAQTTATRIAQLLLEDWQSTGGDDKTYDPLKLNLGFSSAAVPPDFTMGLSLGSVLNNVIYNITVNNVPMSVMLSWSDVDQDHTAGTTLRQLRAMVRWQQGYVLEGGGTTLCNSPVVLTTSYIRLDAGGG
jgi:prepilin-type N-terminal cleavage/methylation domain-containing protein